MNTYQLLNQISSNELKEDDSRRLIHQTITEQKNKVNKHTSRYNFLPLLRFRPGGVQKELTVCRSPGANVNIFEL